MEVSEERLRAIETKIDRLTDAISKLAVVDERITNLISNNSVITTRITELEKRTSDALNTATRHEVIITRLERLQWLLTAGIITAWLKIIFGG